MSQDFTVKPITVGDLIAHLQTLPQDLPVGYHAYSEHNLLQIKDLAIEEACLPRPDGWVHDARPDKATTTYLMFPGN